MQHETSDHDQMQASKGGRKSFIITHQPSKTCGPGKRAFDYPSPRQQDKAALGLRKFDDFQLHAVLLGGFSRNVASISLINERQFDRLASRFLYLTSEFAHLSAIFLVGMGHQQAQQIAQSIHGNMDFTAFASLGSIIARTTSAFGRRLQGATIKD